MGSQPPPREGAVRAQPPNQLVSPVVLLEPLEEEIARDITDILARDDLKTVSDDIRSEFRKVNPIRHATLQSEEQQ